MQSSWGWDQWPRPTPPPPPYPYVASGNAFQSSPYDNSHAWSPAPPAGAPDHNIVPQPPPPWPPHPTGTHSFSHPPPVYPSYPQYASFASFPFANDPANQLQYPYQGTVYPPLSAPSPPVNGSHVTPTPVYPPPVSDQSYSTAGPSSFHYPPVEETHSAPPSENASYSPGATYSTPYFQHSTSFSPAPPSRQESCSSYPPEDGLSRCQSSVSDNWSYVPGNLDIVPVVTTPSKRSLKYVLLHGTLDVWIHAAKCLPNMDLFSERLRQCLTVCKRPFQKIEEHVTQHTRKKITSDPYASVVLRGATVARTRVISNDQDPTWNEHFSILVAHNVAEVELVVKDNDILGAQLIGKVKIPAESLQVNEMVGGWYDLLGRDGKPCKGGAQLMASLKFKLAETDPFYKHGVGSGPDYSGVPNTYFPLRKGGRLTLYQDADVLDNSLPEIKLDGGLVFEHRRCWEEICTAILEAHHLVYIAGWSIYCKIKLIRRADRTLPERAFYTLGELLKYKSRELVRVLLLVWDDKTSHSVINNEGVMGTHDEETRRFFKHSAVQCILAPRYADSKLSWFKQQVVGTLYTHHQKLVIVDTQGPGNFRRLSAFIGGLDLCDGRYDTPEHSLFRTLNTCHKDDYHNPIFPTKAECGGPREPWHDLHCKIEGPAAYDVLTNFEQRWRKYTRWGDDALANLDTISWILSPNKKTNFGSSQKDDLLRVQDEDDTEAWHVQVFRSIDSGSVKGFPKKDVLEAEKQNLVCGKNIAIDMSIHTAYIKAIRSAQHFIYIENQYFLGSSYAWLNYKDAGANHLIPIELALKVASKIKAKERFAVYVVIPMWPEGVPESNAVQEILFFQGQTMEMMYTIIAQALEEAGLADTFLPTDYLNFFCLGNREVKGEDELPSASPPPDNSPQLRAQKNRRFMIYVHAKGMIVDDEYVIIGSANINQRSMDGARDTEIAMGAYQPYHVWAYKQGHPRGQIYGYRMSLWAEHMGVLEDCFTEPWSLECVRRVKSIGEGYWKQFVADEVTEMKGHLLPYPVKVENSGKVVPLPEYENFPDVGGRILGCSTTLPDNLTT